MLSLRQIQHLLDTARKTGRANSAPYRRIIRRILDNGRCHCPAVRQALIVSTAAEVIAEALALQRCCELTWAVTPLGSTLAQSLTSRLSQTDLIAEDSAAAAIAVRALLDWADLSSTDNSAIISNAVAALAQSQDKYGLLNADVMSSAIVLWQLSDRPEVARRFGSVHWERLVAATRRCGSAISKDFSRFAYAMAA